MSAAHTPTHYEVRRVGNDGWDAGYISNAYGFTDKARFATRAEAVQWCRDREAEDRAALTAAGVTP